MNFITKWAVDPKHAAAIKMIQIYCVLLLRIILVVGGWMCWIIVTPEITFAMHPLRSWIVPLTSAALFCLLYMVVRNLDKGFRTSHGFRRLGTAAPWIGLTWVVFAGFRFVFLIAYVQIFDITGKSPSALDRYVQQPYGLLPVLLLVCIFSPVVEEITFRGLIQRALERRCAPVTAITIAAGLFAVLHFDGEMVVPHFIGGMVYGYTVFITRSVWAGVIMHVGHNTLITGLGYWVGPPNEIAQSISMLVTISVGTVLFLMLAWLSLELWKLRRSNRRSSSSHS
jgi:membrane protease YdiL (CAAX protease family)